MLVYHNNHAASKLWSNFQAGVRPQCRVEPSTVEEVAHVLGVVRRKSCRFAVLGGGKSPFKGSSNAEKGITIDLQRLNSVRLHDLASASPYVTVGGGALWTDVYAALEPYNMYAVGTRASFTGVAGSILGGIYCLNSLYGFR